MNREITAQTISGWLYVLAQFILIACCLWGAISALLQPKIEISWLVALLLLLSSFTLGFWSLWSMGSSTFSVLPKPVATGTLCDRGPYRWLCHPMYTAVLLLCLAACLVQPSLWRATAWCLLLAVLIGKLRFEEKLLSQRFEQYAEFQRSRHRLLPGVW